jgi:pyruvate formate lyase activating enzyme
VAFTYNDPTIFWEYAADVADACHDRGIKAVAVTAGYMCAAPRAEFYRHIDAANVDLKAFTEDFCVPEGAASENEQASGQCRVGEAGCGQT